MTAISKDLCLARWILSCASQGHDIDAEDPRAGGMNWLVYKEILEKLGAARME